MFYWESIRRIESAVNFYFPIDTRPSPIINVIIKPNVQSMDSILPRSPKTALMILILRAVDRLHTFC